MKRQRLRLLGLAALILAGLATPGLSQDQPKDQPKDQAAPPPPGLGPRINAPAGAIGDAPGQPPGPKVETVSTHNGWVVQCSDIPAQAGQPAVKSCGMTQTGKTEKNAAIGLSIIVNRVKGQDGKMQTMMRALVPVGVYLPTGVAMEIDGTALEGRMSFTRCNPRACESFGEASEATMKKFNKGKAVTFYIYDRPGNGYPIKFPLGGFSEGVADLDKFLGK